MSIACKYCIATKGFSLRTGQLFETDEELFDHIEMEHDIPVEREGENEEETMIRFRAKNPRAGGPDCRCPGCLAERGSIEALQIGMVDRINQL